MSGFLTRLSQRALGQAAFAAPRVPSRYEPLPEETGQAAAPAFVLQAEPLAADADGLPVESGLTVPPAVAQPFAAIQQPSTRMTDTVSPAASSAALPLQPLAPAVTSPIAASVQRRATSAPVTANGPLALPNTAGSAVGPNAAVPVSQPDQVSANQGSLLRSEPAQSLRARQVTGTAETPRGGANATPVAVSANETSRTPASMAESVADTSTVRHSTAPPPAGNLRSDVGVQLGPVPTAQSGQMPNAARTLPPLATTVLPVSKAPPAPTIAPIVEITIGTVEIRATLPSQPASAPSGPVGRTLDAYLSGEGRR
jgi:hypothetical protein